MGPPLRHGFVGEDVRMTHMHTKLAHLGRTSAAREQAVNPPLVRASTTLFDTVDDLRDARRAIAYEVPRYGLYGTSTTFELQTAMAELCSTQSCLAIGSGLAAIAAVLSAHARPGAHILIQDGVYGPTRSFAEDQLSQVCDVAFFSTVEELEAGLVSRTSLVLIEVPTSMTMRIIDIRAVAAITSRAGVPLACDATWGTPLYLDAHGLGVDISIHAATKYIGGHSDIMLGLVTGRYEALASTREWCLRHGQTAAPDVCWLGLRGLRTLAVRMARHQASALKVGHWLEAQPAVERVLFPALPSDPHHDLWSAQFSGAPGLLSMELRSQDRRRCEHFVESLRLFDLGASWGGFESLVLPSLDDPRLVRLHVGLEDADDLIADLHGGLAHL
jgi:cysteine-S-conjugate beta-lyase